MPNRVVHFEIGCANIVETIQFYKSVFDWEIVQSGRSATVQTGGAPAIPGHINQLTKDDPQQYVTIYIETDSLEADLDAVVANGGEKMVGPLPLPDGRSFAWIKDNGGNIIGLISAP